MNCFLRQHAFHDLQLLRTNSPFHGYFVIQHVCEAISGLSVLFLSSSAGGIQQILQSDCFLEREEFLIRIATAGGTRRCVMSSETSPATLYVLCNLLIFLCQVQIWTWPPTKTITAKASYIAPTKQKIIMRNSHL